MRQPGGQVFGSLARAGTSPRLSELDQVLMFDLVEVEDPRERRKHLSRRVCVAPALEPQVVVGTDPRQHGDLFAPKSDDTAVRPRRDTSLLRCDQVTPHTQIFA